MFPLASFTVAESCTDSPTCLSEVAGETVTVATSGGGSEEPPHAARRRLTTSVADALRTARPAVVACISLSYVSVQRVPAIACQSSHARTEEPLTCKGSLAASPYPVWPGSVPAEARIPLNKRRALVTIRELFS